MKNAAIKIFALLAILVGTQKTVEACHAIALVNINQQIVGPNDIQVTAASNSPTCGCATYWLDVEVRCLNEPFDGAPFNPGFWGPLNTYPYFQSAQMNKPNCVVQNYPWVTIPFAGLCPGMTYQYRMRENHNGAVGPWSATQTFVVPGATAPLVINAITSNQTICAGDCVTLSGSVVSGCGLAATYTWDNGAGTGQSVNVCPAVTTTYTLTVQEQCSGFTDQASVTVTIVPPPVPGVANLTTPAVQCAGNPVNINLTGSQGTIQWESAPNAGGPWTPMAGETGTTLNVGSLGASTCYQAAVTGCAPLPAGSQTVYSNVVCVTVDPAPTANFNFVSACVGNATTFTDASLTNGGSAIGTWAWDFGDGNTSNQQNPSHTYAGPGPFNVTLTVTNASGCQHTVVLPVNTDPSPTANFNATPGCPGAPTTFTDASNGNGGTINQWAWDFGDGNTSNQQNPSNSYAASGNYNVTLTVTTTTGCTDQVVIPITVPENPVAAFNATTGCLGTPTNFTDGSTVGGGSTITGWNWDFGDGNTSTGQNPNNTYGAAGNYNVTLSVTSSDGCTDQIVLPIQVFAEPIADFNFVPACGGNPTSFTDNSLTNGGSAITTWNWDFGDGNTSTQQNPTNTYVTAGPFNVTLTVTNADGCSNTVVLPVTTEPSPTANFNFTATCETFATTFTDASNGNGGTINQWAWDFGDGNTSTQQNPSNTYAAAGTYNVSLTVTTTAGCVNQIIIPVTIPENPVAAFNTANVCDGNAATFTDASTVGGGYVITNWDWDFGDGNTSTAQNPTHTYAGSGTYNVTLTVTTDAGCTDQVTIAISVFENPTADFNFVPACGGNPTTFTDNSVTNGGSAITTWAWDFDDGNTSTQQNPSNIYVGAGPFNVSLTVTNADGCSHTVVIPVNAAPSPIADFTYTAACPTFGTTFTDISNGNGATINQWDWDFGDGNTSTAQNPTNNYAAGGNYNVTLTVTTTAGCVNQIILPVVIPEDPVPAFNMADVCPGTIGVFTDVSTVGGGATITGWNWDMGDGNTYTTQVVNHAYATSSTYNVSLTVTTSDGCVATLVQPVTIYPLPIADFSPTTVCQGEPTVFNDLTNPNGATLDTWNWDINDDGSVEYNTLNPTHTFPTAGTFNVELMVNTINGCADSVVLAVTVDPAPVPDFTFVPDCEGAATTFTDASTVGGGATITGWAWDFGDGNTSAAQNPSNTYTTGGTYNVQLVVTTSNGCTDSVTLAVVVPENPVASFTMSDVCQGTVGTFTDNSTVGGGATITGWNWDMDDGNTFTTPTVNHAYGTSNTYNVQLTVTSDAGCVDDTIQPVTIYPNPTADFNFGQACEGFASALNDNSNGNGGTIDTWAWDILDDGSVEYNTQNATNNFPAAGTYNVELFVSTVNGCADSVVLPITVDPSPVPDFNFVVACPGTPTTFTDASTIGAGAITGWQWNFDDGNTSTAQNPTNAYNGMGSYQVQLITTSALGCIDSVTLQVDIPDIPLAEFSMSDVCDGVVGTFTDVSTVGAGATINNWNWDMGDGNIFTTPVVNHAYAANGTYNVTLTVTSDAGCTDDTTMTVTIYPNPIADFNFAAACSGNPTGLTDISNPNGGVIDTWSWDILDDGSVEYMAQNPNNTFPGTGTYNVELFVSTVNGCSDSIVLPVTVEAPPVADFTLTNICETQNTTFNDISNVAVGAITNWDWDFGNGNTSTQQNPTETYANENIYNVQLVVTSDLGCTDTMVQQLSVFPIPVPDFTPQSVCLNVETPFTDLSTVSNTNTANTINQWDWDFGDGTTSTVQNPPPHTYTAPGQFNITLTVTTDNGCVDSLTVPIDIYDQPVADFTFNNDCIDQTSPFTDASTVNGGQITSWSWDFNADGVTDDITQNPVYQFPAAGTYNVTLIAGSALGCNDTVTLPITMFPMPVADFTTGPECVYDSVAFNNLSSVAAPSTIVSQVWSFGDGSPLIGTLNPAHLYANEGSYNVQLIVTTGDGCVDDITIPVQVFPQPVANFTANTVCENEPPTVFTNISTVSSGAISSYSWDFGDGNATSVPSPTHTYGSDGVYNVTLIATSDFGCTDTIILPVTVFAAPTAAFSADATDGCPVFCPQFIDQSLSNATSITTWQWDLGDGTMPSNQHPTNCYDNQGNDVDLLFDVGLIVTNDLGCSDTLNVANYITVHPVPVADFYADPVETDEHNPIVQFYNNTQGGNTYDWDFGGNGTSNDVDPSHFFTDTGQFVVTLTAYSVYGCVDTATGPIYISPVPTIYVPNAFTPDGDGTNDIFLPSLYGYENAQYELYIFDRWGQLIFESYSQNVGWDGNVKGGVDNSKTDVYVWKIILRQQGSGEKKEYVGHVTLLK